MREVKTTPKTFLSLWVEASSKEKLAELAKKDDRTLTWEFKQALKEYLERREGE